jgi:hypothetical protein
MAATYTTLAAAAALGDQSLQVTSATGFATGNLIQVDSEFMVQTGAAVGTVIPVRRGGQNATAQQAHRLLAPVLTGLPSDFPLPQPGHATNPSGINKKSIVSYGADGAIVPPTHDTVVFLDKATAAAMTLESPPAGTPDGVEVTIYSNTAAAHTVTYTPGFNANTTTSDVATFAATKGNSITILSAQGLWGVKAAAGVTLG